MDTGVAIFPAHGAIAPADMARLAEERGHESLFFPEHTHILASRQSPWPDGGDLPRKYAHTFDLVLEAYEAAGFQRAVHWLPSAPRGPVERALDRFEQAVAELYGE